VKHLSVSIARRDFAEVVNRAYYSEETTVITKHGKDIAAVVPISMLSAEFDPDKPKKKPGRASSPKQMSK
jgi:prevent-host-death family protein